MQIKYLQLVREPELSREVELLLRRLALTQRLHAPRSIQFSLRPRQHLV